MIRKYSLIVESGPDGISGYVPELPSILVTGSSSDELMVRAAEGYQDLLGGSRRGTLAHVGASRDRSRTPGLNRSCSP